MHHTDQPTPTQYKPPPGVDAVFNLELPSNAAHYAHRAGRTGRMGASGLVVSVAAPGERFVVDRLAARLGVEIEVRCMLTLIVRSKCV
jgi:superfamily II DNA/RNA helicase